MNSEITAGQVNYGELLDESKEHLRRVIVPSFQRSYVWKKRNIEDLINSICDSEGDVFFGNLMLQNGKNATGNDVIIDGQQRFVTFSLLVSCLSNHLSKKNTKSAQEILFLKNNEPKIEFKRTVLNDVYIKILNSEDLDNNEKETAKNLLTACRVITKKILEIYDKNIFFDKLMSSNFVLIKLPRKYPVYSVFESLNSRNTPLKPIELTKNSLLGFADSDQSSYKKIESTWEKLQENFEQAKRTNDFDVFLRYRSFQKYGYLNNSQLFSTIINDDSVISNPLEFSTELLDDSKLWLKLRDGIFEKPPEATQTNLANIDLYVAVFKKLNLRQVYAVIFAIHKSFDNVSSYRKKNYYEDDLKKLFVFSILAKVLKISPPKYEKLYAIAAADFSISKTVTDLNRARKKLFTSLKNLINEGDREKFAKSINENIFYDGRHRQKNPKIFSDSSFIVRLLLVSQKRDVKDAGTIEHIIPKNNNWRKNWPHIKESLNSERFKLGNLTVLKNDLAGELSFEDKVKKYRIDDYSKLSINRRIVNKTGSASHHRIFTLEKPSKDIVKRGEEIGRDIFDGLTDHLFKQAKKIV